VTDGTLAGGASVSWPRRVPLGQEFPVREPVWEWGFGAQLINDDAGAIAAVVLGGLVDGFCVLLLVSLVKLANGTAALHASAATRPAPLVLGLAPAAREPILTGCVST
jgi:hypothetical protein